MVHEIFLQTYFYPEEGDGLRQSRYNARQRMFGKRLNPGQIAKSLYNDKRNAPFLNNKTLKYNQMERLLQKMIDRFEDHKNGRSRSGSSQKENSSRNIKREDQKLIDQEKMLKNMHKERSISGGRKRRSQLEDALAFRNSPTQFEGDFGDRQRQRSPGFDNPRLANQARPQYYDEAAISEIMGKSSNHSGSPYRDQNRVMQDDAAVNFTP